MTHLLRNSKKLLLLILFSSFFATSAFSHSGRTNSSGCHNNNKTGGYHCHNSGSSSSTSSSSLYNSYKPSSTYSFKPAQISSSDVWVNGYYRSNGTYVNGHYRSKPDGVFSNNWSTFGNVNLYTGKLGTKVAPSTNSRYNYNRSSSKTNSISTYSNVDKSLPIVNTVKKPQKKLHTPRSHKRPTLISANRNRKNSSVKAVQSTNWEDFISSRKAICRNNGISILASIYYEKIMLDESVINSIPARIKPEVAKCLDFLQDL